jgi:hypothetical protein
MSEVTGECLQNLMSKGYMTTVEFASSVVPAGSASPALVEGFIMVCMTFFEQGFDLSSHQFLLSLLWSYGLGYLSVGYLSDSGHPQK